MGRPLPSFLSAALVSTAAAQGVWPAAPPPPLPDCTYTPDPSKPNVYYDLTPVQQALTTDLSIPSADGNSRFFVRICRPPTRTCSSSQCSDCDVSHPAGTDTWSSGSGNTCGAIGALGAASTRWGLQDPTDPTKGATITYTNGDSAETSSGAVMRRQVTIFLDCEPGTFPARGVSAAETPPGSLKYVIHVAAWDACVVQPKPLSWGWLTIILSSVAVVVYFGGGSAYNAKYRGEEGMNIIPQWQYWQQLPGERARTRHPLGLSPRLVLWRPTLTACHLSLVLAAVLCAGLVKDGLIFSWTHGRVAAYNAPREIREWYRGRGSQELRAPIAAAAE